MFNLLIIDDDALTRTILQRTLKNQGYAVSVANNGQDGLEQALQIKPALIISDWLMPEMDGLEVCIKVKTNPSLSTTFFILLTNQAEVEDRIQGLDAGADDFLSKPIDPDELKARVRAGLRIHQLNQDLQAKNQILEQVTQDLQTKNRTLEQVTQDLNLQKQVLEVELSEASAYVRSLLPDPLVGSVTVNSRFIPSSRLGGDSFDFYWLDSDCLAIYLLDVSGHGIGSALLSISVLNVLRSQSLGGASFYNPSQVLQALNEAFPMENHNDKYFTIWYGVYNQTKRQLVYANAGHPPGLLLSPTVTTADQVKQLTTEGWGIGLFPDNQFVNEYCNIEPSSTLYLFSDGVYEIMQPGNKLWGLDAFTHLLLKHEATNTADLDQILHHIQGICTQTGVLSDDASLLQVRFS
ncbi:MAG: SpoIIE family protein phosphatase [Leptolyngbyaceae bacterium]|nr:SpoIIE family protein phosphatase [Leptolyngbyaceae bacterium]